MKGKELSLPFRCSQGLGKDNATEQELVLRLARELGQEQELVWGGPQSLGNMGCNNAAQVGTDRANNRGLGTSSKPWMRPCKPGASLFLCL